MTTITEKQITWTTGNGSKAIVSLKLKQDAAGYTTITAFGGIGFADTMFDVVGSALPSTHPAVKAGATNGCLPLVWTAERNAEIVAAYNEIANSPAHVASESRKAANLCSAAADTINGDINNLCRA